MNLEVGFSEVIRFQIGKYLKPANKNLQIKMAQKPSIPKGTRDFSPSEVAKRQYIISIIKNNFEKSLIPVC